MSSDQTEIAPSPGAPAAMVPAQATAGGNFLTLIERLATDPAVDVSKLGAILDLQERIMRRNAETEFNQALHAVQSEMPRVQKNGLIDMGAKGSMKFATFGDMHTALHPLMISHGFTVTFDCQPREGGGGIISATLLHRGGHHKTIAIPLPLDSGAGRNSLQAQGSTLSYGKRYLLEMLFLIVRSDADDDGVRGGLRFIDEAQEAELEALLTRSGRSRQAFLDWAGVGDLGEVETKNFTSIKNALISAVTKREARA